MSKGEAMANSNHFDLKKLKEEYMIANMELMRVKTKAKQQELEEYIGILFGPIV